MVIPMSVEDFLPENHLARFIWKFVDRMDLRSLLNAYKGEAGGRPAVDPKGLLAVILYGHATGRASTRELEWGCREEIGFHYLCGGIVPDHSTLSRFRIRHQEHVEQVFAQVLAFCAEAGLVQLGVVALDGTKISANASLDANRTFETLARELEAQAKAVQEAEATGVNRCLPRKFARMVDRFERLEQAKSRLEGEQAARAEAHEEHLQERAEKERKTGKKLRGRNASPKRFPGSRRRAPRPIPRIRTVAS
jgi:transposase